MIPTHNTYTASVLAEEMLKAGQQVVVADPIGVWYGLRASANGSAPGLPIAILGGDHGDIPLEATAGQIIADAIVDERISAVLDLSLFSKNDQRRFMTDFAERLYHRNRSPLHLVLDEADAFAPQRPMRGAERLLGAIEDIVRRGRARGLGATLVTQRAAVLNKDVLTQCEVLVALRTIAPQDRDAVDAWIRVHGTPEQRDEMMSSLPSLPIGDAWFWSPGWLDVFQRVHVRRRETFDSSATPKVGEAVRQPKQLADVGLDRLRELLATTIEKAAADDPAVLRRRIQDLERQIRTQAPHVERIEVPVLTEEDRARLTVLSTQLFDTVKRVTEQMEAAVSPLVDALERWTNALVDVTPNVRRRGDGSVAVVSASKPDPIPIRSRRPVPDSPRHAGVTGPQQRILDSLAWFGAVGLLPADRTQLALFAGTSPTSSAFGNNLGSLRTAGLIDYPAGGKVTLTDEGARLAQEPLDAPRTSRELQDAVCSRLSGPQQRIIRNLCQRYPLDVDRRELAEETGASATSSAYGNNLGALRTLGLIDYPSGGRVVARHVLFLEGSS